MSSSSACSAAKHSRIVKMAVVCTQPQVVSHRDVGGDTGDRASDPGVAEQAASVEAERLLLEARVAAEALLSQARTEAESVRQQAQEEGWRQGWEAGRREAEAQMLAQVQALRQLAAQAQIDRRQLVRSAREQIIALVLGAAEKVVRRCLEGDRDAVVRVVQEALEQLDPGESVKIRVNPADWETVSLYWTQTRAVEGEEREGEIVVDASISPGGCIVETRTGSVNGEVEVQLGEIGRALME